MTIVTERNKSFLEERDGAGGGRGGWGIIEKTRLVSQKQFLLIKCALV